jgi:putative transcriptional regulator
MSATKTKQDTTELSMLAATKDLNEALYRLGVTSEEDAASLQKLRGEAGAPPLSLIRGDLRNFDASALTPELAPERIRALREREGASQAVLAKYLGVATATLSQWERGARRPDGPALRLLGLAERHGLDYIH